MLPVAATGTHTATPGLQGDTFMILCIYQPHVSMFPKAKADLLQASIMYHFAYNIVAVILFCVISTVRHYAHNASLC